MRPWYKKWPAAYPPEYYLCSERARHVYDKLLDACGTRQEHDGLAIVAETVLQIQTAMPLAKVRSSLLELVAQGLIERDLTGAVRVPFFVWQQRKIDATAAVRKKRSRIKKLTVVTPSHAVTNGVVTGAVTEQEEQKDRESSPVPSEPPTTPQPPARRQVPEWVTELRGQYKPLKDVLLTRLTLEQRHIAARYYAYMLCRCTKSLARNRQRSSAIDAGIGYVQARIGKDPKLADMTTSEFIDLGRKRATRLDVVLWKPTDVLAEVEFEGAQA